MADVNKEYTSPEVAREAGKLMRHPDPLVRKVAASALNQAPDKKKYIAATGIDFEGLKGKPRVEAGERIPSSVSPEEIEQLLKDGLIKEA